MNSWKTLIGACLWVGCSLLTGCVDAVESEGPPRPAAAEQSLSETSASDTAGAVRRWTSDGRVAAVFHRDRSPLFTFGGDEPRAELTRWAQAQAQQLGFAPLDGQFSDALFGEFKLERRMDCLLYTSPSPRD